MSKRTLHADQLVSADPPLIGPFRIGRIDYENGVADLVHVADTGCVERAIPLGKIHPIREDANQAAARIVREATEG